MAKEVTGARLEAMTPGELDAFGRPREVPPAYTDPAELPKLAREVDTLVAEAQTLASHPDAEVADAIGQKVRRAGEIAFGADAAVNYWSRPSVLQRSKFSANPAEESAQRTMWMQRLTKATDNNLVGFARQAALEQNVALAACIGEELASRDGMPRPLRVQVASILDGIPTEAEAVAPILAELANAGRRLLAVQKRGQGRFRIAAGLGGSNSK